MIGKPLRVCCPGKKRRRLLKVLIVLLKLYLNRDFMFGLGLLGFRVLGFIGVVLRFLN